MEPEELFDARVALVETKDTWYPQAPFSPSERYPEYAYEDVSKESNSAYDGVRNVLRLLKMDAENFGSKQWNPFKNIIKEDSLVLIKPAMTTNINYSNDTPLAITPHASVIRPIIDYALLAKPRKIVIADGPIPNAKFENVVRSMELDKIVDFYNKVQSIPVELMDLRDEYSPKTKSGRLLGTFKLKGDPLGYSVIKFPSTEDSFLYPILDDWREFTSVSSVPGERQAPPLHCNKEKVEYSIPNSLLQFDTVINVPKLKNHRKSGISCVLKNIVGITNKKYWLPHFRNRKDESHYSNKNLFGRFFYAANEWSQVFVRMLFKGERFREIEYPTVDGNWPGDDTVWRMVLDLYRMLIYLDKDGIFRDTPQRKHFSLIDGIIGGENFGPLAPTIKKSGIIMGGFNPVHVDYVATKVIGIKKEYVRFVSESRTNKSFSLVNREPDDVEIISDSVVPNKQFVYPSQWDNSKI